MQASGRAYLGPAVSPAEGQRIKEKAIALGLASKTSSSQELQDPEKVSGDHKDGKINEEASDSVPRTKE